MNEASYYAFTASPPSIWRAISAAGRRIHTYVRKEMGGYWRVTVVLPNFIQPGIQEYLLPADCAQVSRVREQLPTDIRWRKMVPYRVTDDEFERVDNASGNFPPTGDCWSKLRFDGPYLTQAQAVKQATPTAQGPYSIRIAPQPVDARNVELIYPSSWIEITSAASPNVIPAEGHDVMIDLATARLVRKNNDSLAGELEKQGTTGLTEFLTFVRSRQQQIYPTQEPYLCDED